MKALEEFADITIENGIIIQSYKSGVILDDDTSKKLVFQYQTISAGNWYPLLVDLTGLKGLENGSDVARYFFNQKSLKYTNGMAFYAPSYFQRMIIIFLKSFHTDSLPIKIFASRESALNWLEYFKGGHN